MALVNRDQIFVATTGNLLQSGTTTDLGIGQLGIFSVPSYQAQTLPQFPAVRSIQIVQGTSDEPLNVGTFQGNSSDKTPVIEARKITGLKTKKADKAQNGIVYMGFNGENGETLTLAPGETKKFWVRLSGTAINYLKGGTGDYHVQEFTVHSDCVDACSDACGAQLPCTTVSDLVIKTIAETKFLGAIPFNKYVKTTPITECTTPSGFVTTTVDVWQVTVADLGDQKALGLVQSQYPGVKVTRESRVGVYSTYQIIQDAQPTALSTAITVIPNCSDCPSGATSVDAAFAYTATKSGIQVASAASGATGYVANSGIVLENSGGQTVIQFYSTEDTLATIAASIPTFVVAYIGEVQALCEVPGDDFPWTDVGDCEIASTTFTIILSAPECGGTLLTDLQAIYGSGVSLVDNNTDSCTAKYALTVTSDESCVDCGDQSFTFTAPAPFNGVSWVEADGDVTGEGCLCGVKFESAYVSRKRAACYFDNVPYVTEPIFIEVSQYPFDQLDYAELCENSWAISVTQSAKYNAGSGNFIADFEKLSKYYFNKPWYSDAAARDVLGYEFNTEFDQYYDQIVLEFDVEQPKGYASSTSERSYEWSIYVPTGQGTELVNALNAFVTSAGNVVAPVSL